MLGAVVVAIGTPIALTGGAPAHAMTCTPDEPISTVCNTAFYVVGSLCRGQLPTKPPLPIALNAQQINLCPPLG